MRVLLTFTGFHDPYGRPKLEGGKQPGPILTALHSEGFDRVCLFDTPGTQQQTEETLAVIAERFPDLATEVYKLAVLHDPTNHIKILHYLRRFIPRIKSKHAGAEFTISLSSGTPSMHACWLLLAADRTIPARVLYSHPPQYAGDSGLISYVDLASPDFPEIIARDKQQEAPDALAPELDECCRALGIIAESSGFKKALAKAGKLAEYDAPILITGETGTGKEQVARLIHLMSGRLPNRFVPLNCSAIPGDLAESILFGHVKGAFTGAHADKKGEFEHAEGGTLFLDEIGELPENMQAKLLRVLQDGKIKPVGGNRERKCDLRMVAATNADLGQAIRRESFRLDLAQRFAATVDLPPLRDRPADIVPLATFALDCFNQEYGDNKRLTRDAIKALRETTWTGNVRELRSCVETSAMLAPSRLIRREDLQFSTHTSASAEIVTPEPHPGFAAKAYFAEVRHNLIRKAMKTARGNQSEAARLLGMTSQWIRKYLPPDFRN